MLQGLKTKKGQSTLEYVILVVVVIMALLTVQTYFKRGVQGRMRSAADDIGKQYEGSTTNHTKRTISNTRTTETSSATGTSTRRRSPDSVTVNDTWLTNNTMQVYVP